MQTECSASLFEFEPVDGKKIVAGFDGGTITSDAGALLLGRLVPPSTTNSPKNNNKMVTLAPDIDARKCSGHNSANFIQPQLARISRTCCCIGAGNPG